MSSVGKHDYTMVACSSEPCEYPSVAVHLWSVSDREEDIQLSGCTLDGFYRRPPLLTKANCSFLLSSADELQLDCLGYYLLRGSCYTLLCSDCCSHRPLYHPKSSFICTYGLIPFCLSMLFIEDQLCSDGREPLEAFHRGYLSCRYVYLP